MQSLIRTLTSIYKYATAFIVLASPLFFIPGTALKPEITYYLVILLAVTLALASYMIAAILTRSWHKLTRFEVISYIAFSVALLLSAVFARNAHAVLFGNDINQYSALSLLTLPAVVFLVRTLPDDFRKKLKKILAYILATATFLFLFTYIFSGEMASSFAKAFSAFPSVLSLITYIGLFVIVTFSVLRKSTLHYKHKSYIGVATLVVVALLIILSRSGDVRPSLISSMQVAKDTLVHQGVFGIGSGDFLSAWQLYRPQGIINSPYFDIEFIQGTGTIPTFFTTIGIFGGLVFIFFMLGALYISFRTYRSEHSPEDKHVAGLLTIIQLYFFLAAWIIPLSFSILILWMTIVGFGLAKSRLLEYHPSKIMMYIGTPIALLLCLYTVNTWEKTRALLTYSRAITYSQKNDTETTDTLLALASTQYPLDSIYRARLENAITATRAIISTQNADQEALKASYLTQANRAVDAGIASVKANPSNYQNYVALGRAYELRLPFADTKDDGYNNAKKSYQEATKLYPANPYLYVMLARLEAVAGSKDAVRANLTEALSKKQNFADALYLMSQLSASEQNIDDALQFAIAAANNAPNDPNVLVQAGLLLYGKKDYPNAVLFLQKALELDQNNANIAYFLALARREEGRTDIALKIGEELLRRNPGNADLTAFLQSLQPVSTSTPQTPKTKTTQKTSSK